jgi:hypothetical protein
VQFEALPVCGWFSTGFLKAIYLAFSPYCNTPNLLTAHAYIIPNAVCPIREDCTTSFVGVSNLHAFLFNYHLDELYSAGITSSSTQDPVRPPVRTNQYHVDKYDPIESTSTSTLTSTSQITLWTSTTHTSTLTKVQPDPVYIDKHQLLTSSSTSSTIWPVLLWRYPVPETNTSTDSFFCNVLDILRSKRGFFGQRVIPSNRLPLPPGYFYRKSHKFHTSFHLKPLPFW